MRKTYKSGKELLENRPEVWKILMEYLYASTDEEEEYLDEITSLVEVIREAHVNSKETVDSCYITETYITEEIDGFVFEVVGSSYRKDQSVCDEELEESFTVIDVKAEKKAKKEKKANQEIENISNWKKFIEDSSIEELLQKLKKVKFTN